MTAQESINAVDLVTNPELKEKARARSLAYLELYDNEVLGPLGAIMQAAVDEAGSASKVTSEAPPLPVMELTEHRFATRGLLDKLYLRRQVLTSTLAQIGTIINRNPVKPVRIVLGEWLENDRGKGVPVAKLWLWADQASRIVGYSRSGQNPASFAVDYVLWNGVDPPPRYEPEYRSRIFFLHNPPGVAEWHAGIDLRRYADEFLSTESFDARKRFIDEQRQRVQILARAASNPALNPEIARRLAESGDFAG